MTHCNKLKGKIVEKNLTIEQVSSLMGIDKSTFYRKINSTNGETFTIREVDLIVKKLELSLDEANAIFFSQFVA